MNSKPLCTARRRQRGQAIVLFLAVVAACCCALALVYNVGQLTNKKEETINAADAAALSGALVEARMLNFSAYTNRASVANEVSIAQLVSLESWMQYNNQLLQNIKTYTSPIPIVGAATAAIAGASQAATTGVDLGVRAGLVGIEAEGQELEKVRELAHAIGAIAANDVSKQIAAANVTTFGGRDDVAPELTVGPVSFGINQISWQNFTQQNSGDRRQTAKDLILNSRDPFSTKRGNGNIIKAVNRVSQILHGNIDYFKLIKSSGRTELKGFDHWEAQDSIDTGRGGLQCGLLSGCTTDDTVDSFSIPLGYGRADAGSNDINHLCDFTTIFGVTTNCRLAEDNSQSLTYGGLNTFRDLADGLSASGPCSVNNGSDSPSLPYVMAVQKSAAAVKTTQQLGMNDVAVDPATSPEGSPQMVDGLQNGGNLTSISAACVFFLRPDGDDRSLKGISRPDGRHEFASLYNPYWQARLTVPDPSWTRAIYLAIGLPGLDQALQ